MRKKSFLLLLMFALFSCHQKQPKKENNTTHISNTMANETHKMTKHWSYQGETSPEHWAEIEKNSDCGGQYQSPINLVNYKESEDLTTLSIQYSDKTLIHDVTNNGHSIQYNFDPGDYMLLDNEKYELKQFHFHEPAEHLIDGVRYPLEIHLVHTNNKGEYAVLGIMAKEGESSEPFNFLESYFPLENNQTKEINKPFDMNLNLPKDKSYFAYNGSLTTPPCSENVKWFIFKNPIAVSLEQVEELRKLMPLNNYRNEQPLNGRKILVSK